MNLVCLWAAMAGALVAQDGWKPLFNGKNLDGWRVVGDGKWKVMADGSVIGLPVSGEKNPFGAAWPVTLTEKQYQDWRQTQSWLYTVAEFGEYDLHLEYWMPQGGNSGISLRDPTRGKFAIGPTPDYNKTPAHNGYEIQIINGVETKYPSGSIYLFAPAKVGQEKVGDWNSLDIESRRDLIRVKLNGQEVAAHPGDPARPKTGPIGLQLHDRFNVVMFRNIRIRELAPTRQAAAAVEGTLEILDIVTGKRDVVRRAREHFEAPNWSRDGASLVYNSGGRLYRIPVSGGEPQGIDTGERVRCNNDHGFSPDGKWLAISDSSANRQSQIYVLPAKGGTPRLITPKFPSYWHGWSPDGKTLAYCARRGDNFDIYTIPVEGGEERRLTSAEGLDDGPDYSPDGKYIYFNSVRSGLMRIWRMRADGSEQHMLVPGEDSADWFPHPSPDGKWIVYLSFDKSVEGHPPNKQVELKMATADGRNPRVLAKLFGGQGTINVPSWSPDSRRIAFVSYRLLP